MIKQFIVKFKICNNNNNNNNNNDNNIIITSRMQASGEQRYVLHRRP